MSIIADLHRHVNTGKTLEQAIDLVIPGADPNFWEPKIKNYNPDAPSPRRRTTRRSRSRSKRTFRASSVLSSATTQATTQALAMAEQIDRTNGHTEETRSVLLTTNGQTYILEVTD